jgi:hypothetical protein
MTAEAGQKVNAALYYAELCRVKLDNQASDPALTPVEIC